MHNFFKSIDQASMIKVAAVLTATPRWVVALLASEGFVLPESWKPVWIIFSVLSAGGMAIVEGVAFAYVFNAWKRETNTVRAWVMLSLAIVSAVLFVILLTPSIVASVQAESVANVLNGITIWIWGGVVSASTITIVASVGYAQKQTLNAAKVAPQPAPAPEPPAETYAKVAPRFPNDFRKLTAEQKEVLRSYTSTAQIAADANISERSAQNWVRWLKEENFSVKEK